MKILVLIPLILIALTYNVNALAVASDYLENDTLFLVDGTSKLYGIRLQNPSSQEIQLQLTYDDAIVNVIDYEEIYTIPLKTNKPIFFNISAPPNSKPGDTYTVSYTVHQLSGSGPGVPILLKINKNFKVKIIKDPNKFYINYSYVAYAIIALAFLLFIYRKKIINYLGKNRKIKFQKKIFEK